ncbi:MAG: response regulator [Terracidiphilus sp.]
MDCSLTTPSENSRLDRATKRILIADDHRESRYVLRRVLESSGYHCLEADTGMKALEIAQTLPDLIILDVCLPDISGIEVCRRLKADALTRPVAVMQISASFIAPHDRVKALEAGADGYLTHPIDRMVLLATVRALLRLRDAEAVARSAAAHWEVTFNSLAEGLAVVGANGRFIRWNHAFAEICAGSYALASNPNACEFLEEFLGTSEPLQHPAGGRFCAEYTVGERTLQVSVSNLTEENEAIENIIAISDITDRKLAEYALRTAEKLAANGKLANAIAHEINNPLEAITNLLFLARSSDSFGFVQEMLKLATVQMERVSRVTRQALAFHRETEYPIPMDVGVIVEEVAALYERVAASRRVRIKCDRQPTLTIYGFPGQLTQVFGNLIRNAAEVALPDTAVTIRVREISRAGHTGTRVTIHDRGCGIPPEIQAKIFDPFFTTKDLKGSGLGLWVSMQLIQKHGGTIRFRTSQRLSLEGTLFEVFLPVGGISREELEHSPKECRQNRPWAIPSAN